MKKISMFIVAGLLIIVGTLTAIYKDKVPMGQGDVVVKTIDTLSDSFYDSQIEAYKDDVNAVKYFTVCKVLNKHKNDIVGDKELFKEVVEMLTGTFKKFDLSTAVDNVKTIAGYVKDGKFNKYVDLYKDLRKIFKDEIPNLPENPPEIAE